MLDLNGLDPSDPQVQIFYAGSPSISERAWQTWTRPRGTSHAFVLVLGSGGGGGGGFGDVAGTARGGGGGGSPGHMTRAVFPLHLLPDTLYVSPGLGGAGGLGSTGGAAATAGSAGQASLINVVPQQIPQCLLLASAGNGGGAGTAAAGGAGGANPGLLSFSNFVFGMISAAIQNSQGSGAGGIGGWHATNATGGGSITSFNIGVTTAGAGGGNATPSDTYGNGGTISATVYYPIISAGSSGAALPAHGFWSWKPLLGTGGGGGRTVAGVGTDGGDGTYGSGGGGGSAGVTGGNGGRGGDGLVIIVAW